MTAQITRARAFEYWWRAGHMALRPVGSDPDSAEIIWNAAWQAALRATEQPAIRPSEEVLTMLKRCADFSAFSGEDDSVGFRVCCGVSSYRPHDKHCDLWNLILRLSALAKGK